MLPVPAGASVSTCLVVPLGGGVSGDVVNVVDRVVGIAVILPPVESHDQQLIMSDN